MSGIFVWIRRRGGIDASRAIDAVGRMKKRGPDHQAVSFWHDLQSGAAETVELSEQNHAPQGMGYRIALGHARLAIVDLSDDSNQPMVSGEGAAIALGGSIFNYIELRAQLAAEGTNFKTASDTEVLLQWLIRNGYADLRALNGSWSFGYADPRDNVIVLSRDPFGERPLYYYAGGDDFIAASEIKSIFAALGDPVRQLDPSQLMAYLAYHNYAAVDPARTMYGEIRRLLPGTNLVFDISRHEFRIVSNGTEAFGRSKPIDEGAIAEDLRRAVSLRLRADVPVAARISGGIDSTSVVAAIAEGRPSMNGIALYTARYPEGVSKDLPFARTVAANVGAELREIEIPYDGHVLDNFSDLTRHYDEPVPIAGSTVMASVMSAAMAKDGVKVVLTGVGGDEIFAGHGNEYSIGILNGLVRHGRWLKAIQSAFDMCANDYTSYRAIARVAYEKLTRRPRPNSPLRHFREQIRSGFHPALDRSEELYWARHLFKMAATEVQIADCTIGRFPGALTYTDNSEVFHSIESRCAFLDPAVAKYIRLPETKKFNKHYNKFALRAAMPRRIDSSVTWRRDKQGATFPFDQFLSANQRAITESIFGCALLGQIFDLEPFLKAIKGFSLEGNIVRGLYSVSVLCEQYDCEIGHA